MTAGRFLIPAIVVLLAGVIVMLSRLAWMTTEPRTAAPAAVATPLPAAQRATVNQGAAAALEVVNAVTAETPADDLEEKLADLNASTAIVPNELILSFKTAEGLAAFQ